MNINKNLVLVKGKDRTEDIHKWEYRDGRIVITFKMVLVFGMHVLMLSSLRNRLR